MKGPSPGLSRKAYYAKYRTFQTRVAGGEKNYLFTLNILFFSGVAVMGSYLLLLIIFPLSDLGSGHGILVITLD
jgi:hypothetical protein